ncbi:preprotein translocase subunit SecY [Candidatus Peregrinibacteria bacterium RIFOXYB2_FULL_32_7]|nr:MAG: preprotein translocase subunit SecY [Candidatus Peregrinibacteria bacterium RIFOXYB2_FULL_32_7]
MLNTLNQIWQARDLRKKIIFTVAILIFYKFLTHIGVPGINRDALTAIFNENNILGAFSLLTGGSAENFSIVMMGISPYINASIIIQLLTVIVPSLENLKKEGQQGQQIINRYTRYLTFPLAFLQSYGMILLLNSQSPIISDVNNPAIIIPIMLITASGTVLLVWLGELISEKGIGNGISLIIFTSIIAGIPQIIGQNLSLITTGNQKLVIVFSAICIITLILTIIVTLFTEAHRRIPITYGAQKRSTIDTSLPIRVNQAGMIPIIFAISLMTFPTIIAQIFNSSENLYMQKIITFILTYFQETNLLYISLYFFLIFVFTFFYVGITFNPDDLAENIQKRGGFIPGIRPGKQTSEYIQRVSNAMNLFGGLFIGFIAIVPILAQFFFSEFNLGSATLLISGAGILIIVGVILDLFRQIKTELALHHYKKLY